MFRIFGHILMFLTVLKGAIFLPTDPNNPGYPSDACPLGWARRPASCDCYKLVGNFLTNQLDWLSARSQCGDLYPSADLLDIRDDDERQYLEEIYCPRGYRCHNTWVKLSADDLPAKIDGFFDKGNRNNLKVQIVQSDQRQNQATNRDRPPRFLFGLVKRDLQGLDVRSGEPDSCFTIFMNKNFEIEVRQRDCQEQHGFVCRLSLANCPGNILKEQVDNGTGSDSKWPPNQSLTTPIFTTPTESTPTTTTTFPITLQVVTIKTRGPTQPDTSRPAQANTPTTTPTVTTTTPNPTTTSAVTKSADVKYRLEGSRIFVEDGSGGEVSADASHALESGGQISLVVQKDSRGRIVALKVESDRTADQPADDISGATNKPSAPGRKGVDQGLIDVPPLSLGGNELPPIDQLGEMSSQKRGQLEAILADMIKKFGNKNPDLESQAPTSILTV